MFQARTSCVPSPSNYLNKDIQYFEPSLYVLQAIKNSQDRAQLGTGNWKLFTRIDPDTDSNPDSDY
jgi:hypothetical protein